ncbi:MAG TPA: protein kinase [Acidobacteriaceae bacterium]|nr:protein kinase [Acidobacteriaceae bacterium]
MPLSASDKLGAYEILEPLGEGGMGMVYRARDVRLDRPVAIKVLLPAAAADPEARQRLRREALAAAALDHPFICKVYEIGEDRGTVFLVMEFIPGETLHHRLRHNRLALPEALSIAGEVAEALDAAHQRRILHRDLKPANIMLSTSGHVKVMDFGLAKRMGESLLDPGATYDGSTRDVGSQLTVPGAIIGTPDYMSPEQVRGLELDAHSDQFSLGVILAEMVSGSHPFRKTSTVETLSAVLRESPEIRGDLPQSLLVTLRRMLAKNSAERFESMAAVRAELRRLAAPSAMATVEAPGSGRIALVGRETELRLLTQQLDEAIAGRGSLVVIGGEPGIGKTSLVEALADAARLRGALVLTGHCYEAEGSPPYVPFIEMLEASLAHGSRDTFRHLLGEEAPEIARIMPELRQMFPDIPPALDLPHEQQRRFLFNAYRAFTERVSKLTPVVSVFEDLHWADEPTLLLLEHLAKSVSTIPRLLIATYRDTDLDVNRPFARTMESLLRQKLATRIQLRRLPVAGVEQMLAALSEQKPPQSLARVIFEETEGNPFFVEEVFHHLAEEGNLFDDSGKFQAGLRVDQLQVPDGVRLVLGRRLQRLSDDAQRILTTAAVIGRVFPLEVLEALEHANPDASLDAVEAAERARLVEAEPLGRSARYRFVHELIRQTLAETLSLPRRQRLHARIAEAMERVYVSTIELHIPALAHHLYEAGAAAPADRTIHYLSECAARAMGAAAFEEALTPIDNALSLVEDERTAAYADLMERRGRCLLSLGRNDEAVRNLQRAISAFEAIGDHVRLIDATYFLYGYYSWSVQLDKLAELAARIAPVAHSGPSWLRGAVLGIRAGAESMHGRIDAALTLLDQMHAIPEESLPPRIQRMVWQVDRAVRLTSGQLALCESSAKKVAALLDPQSDLWYLAANDSGFFLAPSVDGRTSEAERLAAEAAERAARIGNHPVRLSALSQLSMIEISLGKLDAAERIARECIALGEASARGLLFLGECSLGLALTYRGRNDESLALLDRSDNAPGYFAGVRPSLLAIALAAAGRDPSRATAPATTHIGRPGATRSYGAWLITLNLAEAWAIAGNSAEAAYLLPFAEKIATEWTSNAVGFPARTAAGIAAAGDCDWARSEEHHRAAVVRADFGESVSSRIIGRVWYADMLLARGNHGDAGHARNLLTEALRQAEATGNALYAQLAKERLAR